MWVIRFSKYSSTIQEGEVSIHTSQPYKKVGKWDFSDFTFSAASNTPCQVVSMSTADVECSCSAQCVPRACRRKKEEEQINILCVSVLGMKMPCSWEESSEKDQRERGFEVLNCLRSIKIIHLTLNCSKQEKHLIAQHMTCYHRVQPDNKSRSVMADIYRHTLKSCCSIWQSAES